MYVGIIQTEAWLWPKEPGSVYIAGRLVGASSAGSARPLQTNYRIETELYGLSRLFHIFFLLLREYILSVFNLLKLPAFQT
jgi:hypothetical protein